MKTSKRIGRAHAQHVAWIVGPQKVGGVYHCGYWDEDYEVLAIDEGIETGVWITVRWLRDNRTGRHCTAWDPSRDRVVSQPAEA